MAGEILIKSSINTPYIYSDGSEKEVKIQLGIHPSDEVRRRFENSEQYNMGVNLLLLLDVSQSMTNAISKEGLIRTGQFVMSEGRKAEVVKNGKSRLSVAIEALISLIEQVRDIDSISLITYSDNPKIVFSNVPGSEKEFMLSKINSITVEANTNISAGLREARMLLNKSDNDKIKKIIFLTDGIPTCDTEEDGILEANYLAESNISLDCLGIGDNIKFSFLEKLSIPCNGRTDIIHNANQAKDLFTRLFTKSKEVIITDVKLNIRHVAKGIRINEHYRGTPERKFLGKAKLDDNREMSLVVGQVEKDQLYNFYFLATIPDQHSYEGPFRIMVVDVNYKIPTLYGNTQLTMTQEVMIEIGKNFENSKKRNGAVEKGYKAVLVKRLEDELEEAYFKKEFAKVYIKFKEIIKVYEELKNVEMVRKYYKQVEDFKINENLNMADLNESRNTSSKADDEGLIKLNLTEEENANICATINKGRNR